MLYRLLSLIGALRRALGSNYGYVDITNRGGETGDTTGWTNELGTLAVRSANPSPYEGLYYFYGGVDASTIASQRLDLLTITGLNQTELNAADITVKVVWRQASYNALDEATVGIRFLDATPTQLSENYAVSQASSPAQAWEQRSFTATKDATARYADILMKMTRNNGTNNDGYIDDIKVYVYETLPSIIKRQSPLGYWRLGEASGTTATDEMGAYNGVYQNTPTYAQPSLLPSESDTCVRLDGSLDYVSITGIPQITTTLTLECWVNPDTFVSHQTIFGIDTSEAVSLGALYVKTASSVGYPTYEVVFLDTALQVTAISLSNLMTAGQTYHCVMVYDFPSLKLYLDGNEVGSATLTNQLAAQTGDWAIGAGFFNNVRVDEFDGFIDEAVLYNTALTPEQILEHYNAGVTTP